MNIYIFIFFFILIIFKYYLLSIILIIFLIFIYFYEEIKIFLIHKKSNKSVFKKNYYNELLVIYNLYNTAKKNLRNNIRSINKNMLK